MISMSLPTRWYFPEVKHCEVAFYQQYYCEGLLMGCEYLSLSLSLATRALNDRRGHSYERTRVFRSLRWQYRGVETACEVEAFARAKHSPQVTIAVNFGAAATSAVMSPRVELCADMEFSLNRTRRPRDRDELLRTPRRSFRKSSLRRDLVGRMGPSRNPLARPQLALVPRRPRRMAPRRLRHRHGQQELLQALSPRRRRVRPLGRYHFKATADPRPRR